MQRDLAGTHSELAPMPQPVDAVDPHHYVETARIAPGNLPTVSSAAVSPTALPNYRGGAQLCRGNIKLEILWRGVLDVDRAEASAHRRHIVFQAFPCGGIHFAPRA